MFFGFVIDLAVLVLLLVGVVKGVQKLTSSRGSGDALSTHAASTGVNPMRLVSYAVPFAGLIATLYALTGLLSILLVELLPRSSAFLVGVNVRERASYYLAA